MSWDVFIMRFPPEAGAIDEIPDDWDPPSLGTGRDVRGALANVRAGIEYSPDGWGDYEGPGFSISTPLNEADDAPVTGVGLFIQGDSEPAAWAALAVADALKARAFDTGSGDFLTADSARAALDAWRAYRDRVLDKRKP
ncbi:hypothetical protein SAMN05428944_0292 [Streptomyces sp. 1222.5]|uniref:hypothetical protein n=1 Tax=unclassified Streptomyces TaxID=2593676 RepID=UPI000896F01D|nr:MULTISPECIES: hypothetical protein [unclassified Streptomyces]PKW12447.1 hypothetical protein BX260_7803 [Streptomyces sp. 5112.2]SEB56268.1 hypothetical protein SAMN05428944_0292 [Streptomyces sp. 1222.5]